MRLILLLVREISQAASEFRQIIPFEANILKNSFERWSDERLKTFGRTDWNI